MNRDLKRNKPKVCEFKKAFLHCQDMSSQVFPSSGKIPMGSFAPVLEENLWRGRVGRQSVWSSSPLAIFVETPA